MEAMKQPTIRVVAVIAEGVPEADTKKLIAYARANNKILIGPATVGGVQVRSCCCSHVCVPRMHLDFVNVKICCLLLLFHTIQWLLLTSHDLNCRLAHSA